MQEKERILLKNRDGELDVVIVKPSEKSVAYDIAYTRESAYLACLEKMDNRIFISSKEVQDYLFKKKLEEKEDYTADEVAKMIDDIEIELADLSAYWKKCIIYECW